MRVRFKPAAAQRADLRARLAQLEQPAGVIALLRRHVLIPARFEPRDATCSVVSAHADRFVMRVQLQSHEGEERAFALKAYSDGFGERVWSHARALAAFAAPDRDGPVLPTHYCPGERVLVFPWLEGTVLSDVGDQRQPELLRRAAQLAAELHRLPVEPEAATSPQFFVDETRGRCDRLRRRWPETAPLIEPLMAAVEEASSALDPAEPAPVHGDMATGQFLWAGGRLVLLDLDMFGYTDPAYDVGHFLAQLERRSLRDRVEPARAAQWLATFRDAYLQAMPHVSLRNVWFYHGVTLVRKIYTLYRKRPPESQRLVPQLAAQARAAVDEVVQLREVRR